jgi:hypothetical protein
MREAVQVSDDSRRCCSTASSNDAIEVDVDCVADGERGR